MRPLDEVENSEWLEELTESYQKIFWINNSDLADGPETLLSEHVNNNYLTFVVKIPTYTAHCDAAFLVNLKEERL